MKKHTLLAISSLAVLGGQHTLSAKQPPNIIYIMADDHASQAISCYGNPLTQKFKTPNIDRIANEGIRLNNCFVTNSISTPSRAAILTGQFSQQNNVYTLNDKIEPETPNLAKEMQTAGYNTAIIGKWHLGTEPSGFDYYNVLPGQGRYENPILLEKGKWSGDNFQQAKGEVHQGHSTDVITNQALKWIEREKAKNEPFFLMCHFKAPHRPWVPDKRFNGLFEGETMPIPENIMDDYSTKGQQIKDLQMMLEDMNETDLKIQIPDNMSLEEQRMWAYQIYIKDYLRCIAGIDENVGRILKYLDENNLTENTIIIYTSDQGFFLGEHGFFDKRLMYEESLRMPFLIRYPKNISPKSVNNDMVMNIDFAPTILDFAGVSIPEYMQGRSFRQNLVDETPEDWRKSVYYRYWMHAEGAHNVPAHYGIRSDRYKLIFYYGLSLGMSGTKDLATKPEWEFYDLEKDPHEMTNSYSDPAYKDIIVKMKEELLHLKKQYNDEDNKYPEMKKIVETYWDI